MILISLVLLSNQSILFVEFVCVCVCCLLTQSLTGIGGRWHARCTLSKVAMTPCRF